MPALLTSTSIRPKSASSALERPVDIVGLARVTRQRGARRACRAHELRPSPRAGPRRCPSGTATRPPVPGRCAVARPSAPPAPVTMATAPSSLNSSGPERRVWSALVHRWLHVGRDATLAAVVVASVVDASAAGSHHIPYARAVTGPAIIIGTRPTPRTRSQRGSHIIETRGPVPTDASEGRRAGVRPITLDLPTYKRRRLRPAAGHDRRRSSCHLVSASWNPTSRRAWVCPRRPCARPRPARGGWPGRGCSRTAARSSAGCP